MVIRSRAVTSATVSSAVASRRTASLVVPVSCPAAPVESRPVLPAPNVLTWPVVLATVLVRLDIDHWPMVLVRT